jgi:predicted alpha/beta-hydrolase family hydrolase
MIKRLNITVDDATRVSALWQSPSPARACCVLAHGAGAGMEHVFMVAAATELQAQGIATLRFQFPYMERRARRPDPPKICQATVRAAVAEAARLGPGLPLFAGGKSFGGRMTSQAQAEAPLAGVRGIVFLGFPLHAPGRRSDERGAHLAEVKVPMLFLQGTRDELASLDLLEPLIRKLGERATLQVFEDANHSFQTPARAAKKSAEVMHELVQSSADWMLARITPGS